MRRYVVVRTDKRRREFILHELEQGRLRQGWGWRAEHDLRTLREKVRPGVVLGEEEAAVWRNRRLLDTEPDGLQRGDIVILPNITEQGRWVLARVDGPYRFELPAIPRPDFGHIVPVSPVRAPDGTLGIVEADNEHVDARLRASMRSMSRMWSVDALGEAVERLVAAIERGVDTRRAQAHAEKLFELAGAVRGLTWDCIKGRYKAAELEHLVHALLKRVYAGGRVEHRGGAGERGADLIVFTQDALDLEYKIAVQVKMHHGVDDDLQSLDQIRLARSHHKVDAGVVITTATETSERFNKHRDALEAELEMDIRVITRDEFLRLVLAHLTDASQATSRGDTELG